jgi:hypothetical protein
MDNPSDMMDLLAWRDLASGSGMMPRRREPSGGKGVIRLFPEDLPAKTGGIGFEEGE